MVHDDGQDDLDGEQDDQNKKLKFLDKMRVFIIKNLMIETKNRKLRNFHILLAICFYLDFFITGFIIGNHPHLHEPTPESNEFLYHKSIYLVIILVQVADILLNFFKI